ncbi:MAG: glycine betaine ABC transporter substrate-binding protein [Gemmataceae bacterium]
MPTIKIGAKKFTESVILAEMATQLIQSTGIPAQREDLGGTPALWLALKRGDIGAYPEYTGTITHEILQSEPADLAAALAEHGVRISKSLGFRNNYAIGMRRDVAAAKKVTRISDLRQYPDLRFGFTHEFLDRPDGWPGLKRHYDLPQATPQGFNHSLAYRALDDGAIDAMELYTTDGEILQHDLVMLDDDRKFFPVYQAVWLYRDDLPSDAVKAIRLLEGRITEEQMQQMNSAVQDKKMKEYKEASAFLANTLGIAVTPHEDSVWKRVLRTTLEHLRLVVPSLFAAVMIGIPLGVLTARRPRLGQVVLGTAGVLQTIPSLALLLFMIPLMGVGAKPAIAALFLYSLLPIVRNTCIGILEIPGSLRESAQALGLPPGAILWKVELPLAARTILAGIKTAAVINVGTATLGGFIGAGGYGQPILRGIDKRDVPLMLEGAIPAAIMALVVQGLFDLMERRLAERA